MLALLTVRANARCVPIAQMYSFRFQDSKVVDLRRRKAVNLRRRKAVDLRRKKAVDLR